MEYIYSGFGKAAGMLFIAAVAYFIFAVSRDLSREEEPVKSRKQYILTVLKRVAVVAFAAFIISGMVKGGGCDSFDNCTDPDPTPQAQTWAYFFLLILVPSMIGLHQGLKTENKEI